MSAPDGEPSRLGRLPYPVRDVIDTASNQNGFSRAAELRYEQNRRSWTALVKANLNVLFQTALLLSEDPEIAESAVLDALGAIDVCEPPAPDQASLLQKEVATQTLKRLNANSKAKSRDVRSLLQADLCPLLRIDKLPRACFVLCLLFGYTAALCAQTLEIEESRVTEFLGLAAIQLNSPSESYRF
jgi:hypothetical protein